MQEYETSTADDLGKLILRLTIGGLLLFHGVAKVQDYMDEGKGLGQIKGMLTEKKLPEELSYGIFAGEVAGPVLMIIGFLTRFGALLVMGAMGFAVYLAHQGDIGWLNEGGGLLLELQALYFFGAFAVLFLGAGRFSLSGPRGVFS